VKQIIQRDGRESSKSTKLRRGLINNNPPQKWMRLGSKSNKEKKMISQRAPCLEEVSSTTTCLKMDDA
jgi:hypothetical protein